ncbi:hypothetical protein H8356DRAFT_1346140 [Neocallimastix lanati (nom. inval.)]|nr:hypothetical protein H8356DRAFT_1346140 [Neocallimastix sp. JGI-2020a]
MKSILVPQDYNLSNTPIYRNQQFYVKQKNIYPVARLITYPTKRDCNKWFLSLYPTKVRLKTIGRRYHFNKFIFNSGLKLKRYSHKLRWYNITLQEKGFHHTNDVLETSNINGVIILNT